MQVLVWFRLQNGFVMIHWNVSGLHLIPMGSTLHWCLPHCSMVAHGFWDRSFKGVSQCPIDESIAVAHLKLHSFWSNSCVFGNGKGFLIEHSFDIQKSVEILASPVFFGWTNVGAPHPHQFSLVERTLVLPTQSHCSVQTHWCQSVCPFPFSWCHTMPVAQEMAWHDGAQHQAWAVNQWVQHLGAPVHLQQVLGTGQAHGPIVGALQLTGTATHHNAHSC